MANQARKTVQIKLQDNVLTELMTHAESKGYLNVEDFLECLAAKFWRENVGRNVPAFNGEQRLEITAVQVQAFEVRRQAEAKRIGVGTRSISVFIGRELLYERAVVAPV